MKGDRLLTTKEVAAYLRLEENSVRAMAREKRIPAIRVGRLYRYRETDIQQWVDERKSCVDNREQPERS